MVENRSKGLIFNRFFYWTINDELDIPKICQLWHYLLKTITKKHKTDLPSLFVFSSLYLGCSFNVKNTINMETEGEKKNDSCFILHSHFLLPEAELCTWAAGTNTDSTDTNIVRLCENSHRLGSLQIQNSSYKFDIKVTVQLDLPGLFLNLTSSSESEVSSVRFRKLKVDISRQSLPAF